jgi:hypothetical protein
VLNCVFRSTEERRNIENARLWNLCHTKKIKIRQFSSPSQERDYNNRTKPNAKYSTYSRNAKNRDLEFDLSYDEFMTFWQEPCYYCGDEIETIGLDRKNNMIGYVIDNIVPCCTTCNYIKRNILNTEEFINKCRQIARKHKGEY